MTAEIAVEEGAIQSAAYYFSMLGSPFEWGRLKAYLSINLNNGMHSTWPLRFHLILYQWIAPYEPGLCWRRRC